MHSRNPCKKQSDNSRSKAGNFHCRKQYRSRQEKYSAWIKDIKQKQRESEKNALLSVFVYGGKENDIKYALLYFNLKFS